MEPTPFLAACVQLRSTADLHANVARTTALIEKAARAGATLVATPENTPFLGPAEARLAIAEPMEGPIVTHFSSLARDLRIHLLLGSFAERFEEQRSFNTSVLFGPGGELLATYRKIHLFDVNLPDAVLTESANVAAGSDIVVVPTALGGIGLSVCYDVRFPELYAALVRGGAEILTIPSAFTVPTGRAHWELLVRARAVETQCHVLAPAQEGPHGNGRESWGRSMIVDPWGTVLAEAGAGDGVILAEIDPARVHALRARMPVAAHRRL